MKVSFSPDTIYSGWLGSKHEVTNSETPLLRPPRKSSKYVFF